jgi:3-oxoacyl-[acyl-carrier-protein] synthase-3
MDPGDFGVRALFGDGAAATLVQAVAEPPASSGSWIGPFVYGSDGTGEANFILPRGGTRQPCPDSSRPESSAASARDPLALRMDGPAIFTFTLSAVPASVSRLLEQAHLTLGDVDQFVFHQANQFMLEHLRRKLNIAPERFVYAMRDCGNTTSSSVPIALRRAADAGSLASGARVMLVGFGVGYSWGATLIRWYAV